VWYGSTIELYTNIIPSVLIWWGYGKGLDERKMIQKKQRALERKEWSFKEYVKEYGEQNV